MSYHKANTGCHVHKSYTPLVHFLRDTIYPSQSVLSHEWTSKRSTFTRLRGGNCPHFSQGSSTDVPHGGTICPFLHACMHVPPQQQTGDYATK